MFPAWLAQAGHLEGGWVVTPGAYAAAARSALRDVTRAWKPDLTADTDRVAPHWWHFMYISLRWSWDASACSTAGRSGGAPDSPCALLLLQLGLGRLARVAEHILDHVPPQNVLKGLERKEGRRAVSCGPTRASRPVRP